MDDRIAEILLEKHFFERIAQHINKNHRPVGHGPRRFKKISFHNNMEHWYGFDQGFVYCDEKHASIEQKLRHALKPHMRKNIPSLQIAFFFQFKVPKVSKHPKVLLNSVSSISPPFSGNFPYYCLDMKKNKTTGMSQHETLFQLSKVANCNAFYALPLVFSRNQIDRTEHPSLKTLCAIPISTAPKSWVKDSADHFIAMRDRKGTDSYWCSTPELAKSVNTDALFNPESPFRIPSISDDQLFRLIADSVTAINPTHAEYTANNEESFEALISDAKKFLPPSFHILEAYW
ncbi:hypothetical protein D3C87_55030 [compost metagenome]